MIKKQFLLFSLAIFIVLGVQSQEIQTGIDAVSFLASDDTEGRFPGTKGDEQSIKYLKEKFEGYDLKSFDFGYVQKFEIVTGMFPGKSISAELNGIELELGNDYIPMSFSSEKELVGDVVCFENDSSSQDLSNKWALVILGVEDADLSYMDLIKRSIVMADKGASGVVYVSMNDLGDDSELFPFQYSRTVASIRIPVLQISRDAVLVAMKASGFDIDELDIETIKLINLDEKKLSLSANIDIRYEKSSTANIACFAKGKTTDEWIIVGAHYDHLGYGGTGTGSRTPELNKVHNGADDNASGVGLVLMLAEYYAENQPETNIAFVLFGAEEQGLIGSKYFVENLPQPISKIKIMINYDMVGRLGDGGISIIGGTTAAEFDSVLNQYQTDEMPLKIGGGGFNGSDQASFYAEKIPVLFFSTGMHGDYHTPADDIDKINFQGMLKVAELSTKVIGDFTKKDLKLTYKESERKQGGRHGGEMKVKLGIMPNMTSREGNGLGVDGVTPGGVADVSGIVKGDKIIELGGKEITGIYEYMSIMSQFKPGQEVKAIIIRDDKKIEIDIKF